MRILLTKPYNLSDHIQPSLGLGYLATAVRKKHDVTILDCIKERISIAKLKEIIKRFNPDVLGLQCYTFDLEFVGVSMKAAKEIRPDIITVAGGPHPTAMPNNMMKLFKGYLDYLFVGEAEIGLPRLLDSLSSGRRNLESIPGLVWSEGQDFYSNPREFTMDLDILGFPAWDLIHPEEYPESQHGAFFKKFPIAHIMVTRGCPYPCTFCAGGVISGKRVRRRSIDNVLNEIRYLKDNFGIKEFHIIDDNFTMDMAYAKEFLRRLKSLSLDMSWAVPNGVRMEFLDEELLGLMRETGLYLISLGIESGSDKILQLMKKGITTAKIRECVNMINAAGIDMAGFFIIGFPGETIESIRQTIRFSMELGLVRANFFTYLPFPGSESYETLEKNKGLGMVDWDRFYFMTAAYTPDGITRKQLKRLHRLAFAKFYLRPRIIWYQMKSIKSFRHLFFLFRRFFRWIVMN